VSSVLDLAEGLARRGRTISGLHCYNVMHPNPDPPALCVQGPVRWAYDETFDGTWRPVFQCWVLVNPANLTHAQQSLFTYLAPTGTASLPAAIYGDPTLGGVANDTKVLGGVGPPAQVNSDSGPLLGAALEVEVTAM
jgi:hypothetical protein